MFEGWANRREGDYLTIVVVPGTRINPNDIPTGLLPAEVMKHFPEMKKDKSALKEEALAAYREQENYALDGVAEALERGDLRDVRGAAGWYLVQAGNANKAGGAADWFWKNAEGMSPDNAAANFVFMGTEGRNAYIVLPGGVDAELLVNNEEERLVVYADPMGNFGVIPDKPMKSFLGMVDQPGVGLSAKEISDGDNSGYTIPGALAKMSMEVGYWSQGRSTFEAEGRWVEWTQVVLAGDRPLGFGFE